MTRGPDKSASRGPEIIGVGAGRRAVLTEAARRYCSVCVARQLLRHPAPVPASVSPALPLYLLPRAVIERPCFPSHYIAYMWLLRETLQPAPLSLTLQTVSIQVLRYPASFPAPGLLLRRPTPAMPFLSTYAILSPTTGPAPVITRIPLQLFRLLALHLLSLSRIHPLSYSFLSPCHSSSVLSRMEYRRDVR